MARPIDADILKKAINTWDKFACLPDGKLEPFRNLEHPEMFEPYIHLRDIIKAIDNAPTIEPHYISDLPDDDVKTLQTLAIDYSDGIAIFERKRQQGEEVDNE